PGPAPSTSTSHSMSALPAKLPAATGAGAFAAGVAAAAGAGVGTDAAAAAPAASRVRITVPSLTLSSSLTFSSFTVPAWLDGISIDALSDSTMISAVSTAITSPGLTSSSMTATSLKSPMSGTLTSTSWLMSGIPSEQHAPQIGEHIGEEHVEAGRGGAVDDAVVPRQRERQDQARLVLLAIAGHLLPVALADAHDRDLGRVDDRREVDAADAAQRADREGAALHLVGLELAFAC